MLKGTPFVYASVKLLCTGYGLNMNRQQRRKSGKGRRAPSPAQPTSRAATGAPIYQPGGSESETDRSRAPEIEASAETFLSGLLLGLAADDALSRLEHIQMFRRGLDDAEVSVWLDSYRPGAPSLAEFGRVLGITKQAAWNRRSRMVPLSEP